MPATEGISNFLSSVAQLCPTLCDPMSCSTPGLPVHHQLPEFTQTHVHQVSDAIQPSHPLSSPSPPAPNPSQQQVFSNESTLRTRWPKYWSFSFSISPSNEHPGLISFRMDWLDLFAVQGTLKSLLQHHLGPWQQQDRVSDLSVATSQLWKAGEIVSPFQASVSLYLKWACALSCSVVSDSVTPWAVALPASLFMDFSRREYQSRQPFLQHNGSSACLAGYDAASVQQSL